MLSLPTPHGDKLKALLENGNLPRVDKPRVEAAIDRYEKWLEELRAIKGEYEDVVSKMVSLLNTYKTYLEVDLIFDSSEDFLYRQKGQLKLDSSVIEEFLPWLVLKAFPDQLNDRDLTLGPATCLSSVRFESSITMSKPGGGIELRQKNHDFAISRKLFLKSSHQPDFKMAVVKETNIAYVAAECKTNLDKTMFQEAAATALDVKTVVPGAKYYLLCEWLDMTPISTATTAIDEVIILRKARRIPSNVREHFNTVQGRKENRDIFVEYLEKHPLKEESFKRFLDHIRRLVSDSQENDILERGYF